MEKLSSGYRINRAADDAAGLAISEKMRAQIGGLGQAQRNARTASRWCRRRKGALNEVHSMLQRVRELAVQYKNGTLSTTTRPRSRPRSASSRSEIERIGELDQFNGISLLEPARPVTFQVGANDGDVDHASARSRLGTAVGARADFALGRAGATDIGEIDAAINTCRRRARRSARCRTASSTARQPRRSTRRT